MRLKTRVYGILVVGRTVEKHLDKLKKVFERLREAGFQLKPKCYFLRREVEYLGHVVSADGVRPNPQKLSAVRNYAQPSDLKSSVSRIGVLLQEVHSSFLSCD